MIEVRLTGQKVDAIMMIVRDLRALGYQQGLDFDFAYTPEKANYSWAGIDQVRRPRHTVFYFYNEQLSSWFILQYAKFAV